MILCIILIGGAILALRYAGASKAAQGAMLGIGVSFVLLVQLTLPAENPLRQATGGSIGNWLIFLAILAAVGGYGFGLRKLRAKANVEREISSKPDNMVER